ncbi:hypothetical protein QQX98_000134 [Neonectria punicea]|uniref:Uncharacterized protein n=1 Tax=Neonectria punicea TaxID=979145 RepID=A0ABR1HW79_9HYPO
MAQRGEAVRRISTDPSNKVVEVPKPNQLQEANDDDEVQQDDEGTDDVIDMANHFIIPQYDLCATTTHSF